MRSFVSLVLLALVGVAMVLSCRVEPNSIKGDLPSADLALSFNGGRVELPKTNFGGSGFSLLVDVYSSKTDGCLFSAGEPGTANYIDMRLKGGMIQLTIGSVTVSTFRVFQANKWQRIAFTVSNVDFSVRAYINGEEHPTNGKFPTGVPVSQRSATLGYCTKDSFRFQGVLDNLVIINDILSAADVEWHNTQFVPFLNSQNLVFYYPFNDLTPGSTGGNSVGLDGASANTFLNAIVDDTTTAVLKADQGMADVIDVYCAQQGITVSTSGSGAIVPFYNPNGTSKGGATQSIICMDGDKTFFTVNQFWDSNGGITQLAVKTSQYHYWRISAPGLKVEHRTWGGWNLLPRGAELLQVDHTSYKFTEDAIMIQAGIYGYIKVTELNGRLSYVAGVHSASCPLVGAPARKDHCEFKVIQETEFDFSTHPVPEMPFNAPSEIPGVGGFPAVLACPVPSCDYAPQRMADHGASCNPPPPPPPPPVLPPPPEVVVVIDPCADFKVASPALYAKFDAYCSATYTAQSPLYFKCMTDSCITGTLIVEKPDCSTERMKAATIPGYIVDPKCNTTKCPKDCSGHGTCNHYGRCTCETGFTGVDCSMESDYGCFEAVTPMGNVPLEAVKMVDDKGAYIPSMSDAVAFPFMRQHMIEDSALVYIAETINPLTNAQAYHLIIMNNNGNGMPSGGKYTLTVAGTGTATISTFAEGGATASVAGSTITFSWPFNGRCGAYVANLPADSLNQITLTISGRDAGLAQLLVGSAYGNDKANGLMTVFKHLANTLTINGGQCQNNCDKYTTCNACAADPKCGWCIEQDRCFPGTRSGPVYYGSCKNWRYTFDSDISRRLTQEYAFPVSPGYTDVYLTSVSSANNVDLPLEMNIAMGAPDKIQWDVAMILEWDSANKLGFIAGLTDFLKTLTTYPNIGVALNTHRPANGNHYDIVKILSNPRDFYWISTHCQNAPVDSSAEHDVLSAITEISSRNANPIGWRDGARKILVITSTKPFTAGTKTIDAVRAALLSRDIIPVFAVTDAVRPAYETLVNNLGFGFVQTLRAGSGNIVSLTVRSLQLASGHAATFYDSQKAGHLDVATWAANAAVFTLYGLNDAYMARFPIPVHREQGKPDLDTTVLHMPAFGTAKIENVKTDKPVAMAFPEKSSGMEDGIQVLELKGRSFRNTKKTIAQITKFPTKGTLYQAAMVANTADPTGLPVLGAGDPVPAAGYISDDLDRVVYKAPQTGYGPAFDTFEFVVTDGCVSSDPVTITLDVVNKNDPPVAEIVPPTGEEDKPMVLTLTYFDTDRDVVDAYIVMGLHEMAADGTKVMTTRAGKLYQYDPQVLSSRDNAATVGVEITGHNVKVTDPSRRIIFWPAPNVNSHSDYGKTPDLFVRPCIDYKVVETATPEKYESNVAQVPIDIRAVNDAPFVFGDLDVNYPYQWPDTSSLGCFKDGDKCAFLEDFGNKYPWDAGYVYVYLGGGDVERDDLDVLITALECDPLATLETDLMGAIPVKVGTTLYRNPAGGLNPLIRFRPGADRNNDNGGFGTHYCKISYKVRDPQGATSFKSNTVTISVAPVDDPPRLRDGLQLVTAIERVPKTFFVDAIDVEGRPFQTFLMSCKNKEGTLSYCLDDLCTEKRDVDCANIPATGLAFEPLKTKSAKRALASDLQAGVTSYGYNLIFTSGPITSMRQGLGYQSLQFAFGTDAASRGDSFTVNINVVSLNQAPAFILNNATLTKETTEVAVALQKGTHFHPELEVDDEDAGNGDLTITFSFEPQDGSHFTVDKTLVGDSAFANYDEKAGMTVTAKLLQLNAVLKSFQFFPRDQSLGTKYHVKFIVNDNGYTGQCGDPNSQLLKWDGTLCPLESTLAMEVTWVDQTLITGAAAAAGGLAAIGLAGLIAFIATRFFNQEAATAGYQPWNAFESDGASLSNPLYEASGIEKTSNIYMGKEYTEMGSVSNKGGSWL